MAKKPKTDEVADVEASAVDAADTAPAAIAAAADDTTEPEPKRVLTSERHVDLAQLNAAAYAAHRADADVKKRAAEAGVRAMQAALNKLA